MAQVEARVQAQGHDGGSGMRRTLAGEHRHLPQRVHAHRVIGGGERIDAIEMVALYPELQLAGSIAQVGAHLEHGHHHDFDHNRTGPGAGGRRQHHGQKEKEEAARAGHPDCDGNAPGRRRGTGRKRCKSTGRTGASAPAAGHICSTRADSTGGLGLRYSNRDEFPAIPVLVSL